MQLPCTISLTSASASGTTVSLSSSHSAVSLPSSVQIPKGASSASFTAGINWWDQSSATATLKASGSSSSGAIALQLLPATRILSVSATSLSFGTVALNSPAVRTITLTSTGNLPVSVTNMGIAGTGFSYSQPSLPLELAPGQSTTVAVQFSPTASGNASGTFGIATNTNVYGAYNGGPISISLSGTGQTSTAAALSSLQCASGSLTGAATDACTVSLSSAAPGSGVTVTLASSSSAVKVPASVTIPAGATSAAFTATVAAVTTSQTGTLTATAAGVSKTFGLQLNAAKAALTLSSTSLSFGSVTLNTPVTQTLTLTSSGNNPLTISAGTVSGTGFSVSGVSFPVTLNPGQAAALTVRFNPTTAGAVTGALTIASNSGSGATATVALSGTGAASAALSGLSCANATLTGSATDACTVSLTAAAPGGGLAVTLASSSGNIKVPASITVPAGASSAAFTATASAVTTTETGTLTATASGVTKSYSLQLKAGTVVLTLGSSSISFGSVDLNSPSTQSLTLTSSGTMALTLSSGAISGTGFSMSGVSFPATLNPGQSATLDVQFQPTKAGAASGSITLKSNATSGATTTITLTGTGASASYSVDLTWDAPSGSVTGYNVYRAAAGSSSFQLITSSPNADTTFTDSSVTSGSSYSYEVTTVDSTGAESSPSNVYTATIP